MTLWTPDGERPISRDEPAPAPAGDDPLAQLSPEERAQAEAMAAEMDEVRRQLSSVPASLVVANHGMGLYELAAIHLSSEPPRFDEAQVAIDALGGILEAVEGRLGDNEPTLRDALGQIRLAFVQLKASAQQPIAE